MKKNIFKCIVVLIMIILFSQSGFSQESDNSNESNETGWITLEGEPGLTRLDVKFHLCNCTEDGCSGYPKYEELSTHPKKITFTFSYTCEDCNGKVQTATVYDILKPGQHASTGGMWHFCRHATDFKLLSFKEEGGEETISKSKEISPIQKTTNNKLKEDVDLENNNKKDAVANNKTISKPIATNQTAKTITVIKPTVKPKVQTVTKTLPAASKTEKEKTDKTVVKSAQISTKPEPVKPKNKNGCSSKFDANGNWDFTANGTRWTTTVQNGIITCIQELKEGPDTYTI